MIKKIGVVNTLLATTALLSLVSLVPGCTKYEAHGDGRPGLQEYKLEDGTRCALWTRGGIDCNWRPSAPAAVLAPQNVDAVGSEGFVVLSWRAVAGARHYEVRRAPISGGPYTLIAVRMGTSYVDIAVSASTYFYVVVAVGVDGTKSASSAQVSAIVSPY